MFDFFSKNNILFPNQSGFRPGGPCISQLISINHDILNVFDKVWHDGLIFKLRQNGICSKMIKIFEDFFSDRKQSCFKWSVFVLG